jgi:hypothetical protein
MQRWFTYDLKALHYYRIMLYYNHIVFIEVLSKTDGFRDLMIVVTLLFDFKHTEKSSDESTLHKTEIEKKLKANYNSNI